MADPIVPRGTLLFQMDGGALRTNRLLTGDDGSSPLGGFFFIPEIGTDRVPGLAEAEARFQELAGGGSAPRLSLGTTRGRFSSNEQVLPLRASYGVLDRLTVSVTVPFVRRRVDALLRLSADGANVGENPNAVRPAEVDAFLAGSEGALAALQDAVDDWCDAQGETDERCQEGRALTQELDSFLGQLSTVYEEEAFFPLNGSGLASLLLERWNGFRSQADEWDVSPPEDLPLSGRPLTDESFRSLVVTPAWGPSGFPVETPRAFLLLGDVEAHVAVSLLGPGRAGDDRPVRIRSALVGTVRLPTGTPDSLRTVAPLSPPRGVGGVEIKSVSDVLLPGRFAALAVAEAGWPWSRDLTLLAPDPDRPFTPGFTRTEARWTPGRHLRLSLTPRFHVHPVLSLGAGWELLRRGADRYASLVDDGPPIAEPEEGLRIQRLHLELRYSAIRGPAGEAARLPFELYLRTSRTVAGTGPLAPEERRIQVGGRLVVRR